MVSWTSCQNQNITDITNIQPLQSIEATPQNHYKTLQTFSPKANPNKAKLDEIRFPKKSNQWLIKTFSPAYLDRTTIKEIMLTLQPPANSSNQTRAELDFLLELQKTRTPEQVKNALRLHDIVYFPIIGMRDEQELFFEAYELLGTDFNHESYPKTQQLLHNIMKEMRIMEFTAKNHILRARPRQLEANLTPLKKMSSSSFASGHTLWAYMQAYLWGELLPDKREAFIDLAYEIGFSREILGVHYPSDEEVSRKLAHQLLTEIWKNPNFKKDFQAAKKEWE